MFQFFAKKVSLDVTQREIVTSGSVNVYQCQFQFDSAWDGLEKTAVFKAGGISISVLLDDLGACNIPWEVFQDAKRTLYAGVYGTKNDNVVLPTIWANCGEIKPGVTQGENTQPPTPDVYSQILQVAKDAEDVAQSVRDDADSGKFNGEQGPTGPQGYTYTPAVSEEGVISWTNDGSLPNPSPVNIKGPQGKQGIQGVQGKQGERGYVYTPNVSQDGIISWTNDGGLENPGPVDIRGPVGPQGGQGEQGIQGPRGYTYTPSVGEDGTVSWTNDGNLPNPDPVNITGPQGETGETPDITAGTVETLEPGQDATAEITGETPNLVLNLGIPKGQPGQDAPQIDDDVVSATNPWSSKKILDTLCPPLSVSGNPVVCYPVEGYPLSVNVEWTPTQEGTGDPSPDNVRPISGWTGATATVCGQNLLDMPDQETMKYSITIDPKYIQWYLDLPVGAQVTVSADYYAPSGNNSVSAWRINLVDGVTTPTGSKYITLFTGYANDETRMAYTITKNMSITLDQVENVRRYFGDHTDEDGNPESVLRYAKNVTVNIGPSDLGYTPYDPMSTTITLSFGQTVYGGTVDNYGNGKQEWGYIASYNGEELTGEWISDRDVYAPGTTPTIGAEVAYKLATPIPFTVTPQELNAVAGTNTIYSSTGDTTVSGRADPNTILQQLAQRIAALAEQAING